MINDYHFYVVFQFCLDENSINVWPFCTLVGELIFHSITSYGHVRLIGIVYLNLKANLIISMTGNGYGLWTRLKHHFLHA